MTNNERHIRSFVHLKYQILAACLALSLVQVIF